MAKYYILIIFLPLLLGVASAQLQSPTGTAFESLGYYPDRAFTSEFQQQVFTKGINQGDWDILAVFLSRDAYVDQKIYNETAITLEDFYSGLTSKGISDKPQKKQIALIVKESKNQFFKTFHPNNSFDSLIQYGFYNCVTASAFLAFTFDKFNIPYSLVESKESIHIAPKGGSPNNFSESEDTCSPLTFDLKKSYITEKMERDEEYDMIYYPQENHSLQSWAAVYFAHDALFQFLKRDRIAAISQMEKAYALNPSDRYQTWLSIFMKKQLKVSRYKIMDDVRIRAKQYAMSKNSDKDEALEKDFHSLSRTFLFGQKNEVHFDSIYYTLQANISDRQMRNRLTGIYYSERGNAAAKAQYFEDAVPFLVRAVATNPKDEEAQASLTRSMGVAFKLNRDEGYGQRLLDRVTDTAQAGGWKQQLSAIYLNEWAKVSFAKKDVNKAVELSKKAYEADAGSETIRETLATHLGFGFSKETSAQTATSKINTFEQVYPFLKNENGFKAAYAYLHLLLASEKFNSAQFQKGKTELSHFENLMESNPDLLVSHAKIGEAYSAGASLLIKKNQLDEAEILLKSGREYAGTSTKITEGLQTIRKLRTGFKKY